jgi:hypothetical protein
MLNNFSVKRFLSKGIVSEDVESTATRPAYPTINPRTATVVTKTADYTVTQAELNAPTIFNNAGDSGTLVWTLPAVALSKGKVARFHSLAAQIMRLLPQTGEAVNLHGSAVVTKYLNIANVIGNYVEVYCDGTQWIVTDQAGVITKES